MSATAFAQAPDQPPPPPAPADPPATPPAPPPPAAKPADKPQPMVKSKWEATLYGFVELDSIYDSTQGLGDLAGNSTIARPDTYAGNHGQMMFGARNSRIGIKMAAPEAHDIKPSAQLEMDFLGNQPTGLVSEQAFWQNPAFRVRHMNVKLETPYVDMLFGQYWQLFGWQGMAQPNTVQIQGIPGELYSRSPQIRLSKKLKASDVSVELAIAASRPPQRASATPDGQVGIKVSFDQLKAWRTAGSTGTSLDSLSLGISGVGRRFAVDEFSATPHSQVVKYGYGFAVDAVIPIVPATKDKHDNALTLTGEFTTGAGIADLYQSLSGGVGNPALPNPGMATPAPSYTPNVDGAMVQWFLNGTSGAYELHPIQWLTYNVGLQYYLPPGNVWLATNFAHAESNNAHLYGAPTKVWDDESWFDFCLFVEPTPAVRFGGEFAYTKQTSTDNTDATDYRGQFSAFFLF